MTAMRRLSGLLQFLIGFVLGVVLFVGGVSLAGYFLFNRFATNPDKPVFPEEQPKTDQPAKDQDTKKDVTADKSAPKTDNGDKPAEEKPNTAASPTPSPSPSPSPTPSPEETLPPGAYQAEVIWGGGLVVRTEPNKNSGTVTSIGYRDKVVVLKTEGEWSQVKVGDDAVGWVRSGNLQKQADEGQQDNPNN